MKDMEGKVVSEEEVAAGLGFKDVFDFRRWQTDLGHKVTELEYELRKSKDDGKTFRWHGMRMLVVLEKIKPVLIDLQNQKTPSPETINKLLLATEVVCGRGVDWDHVLEDWWKDLPTE